MIQWQANNPKPDIHIRKAALAKFLARFPDRIDIRLKLADQHLYLGETQLAWNILSEVQDDARTDPDWSTSYGKVARTLGRTEVAEEHLMQAWNDGSILAGIELSRLFSDQTRHENAIELSKTILSGDATNHAAAMVLCKNLIATGELKALWEWAQTCLTHKHSNAVVPSALAYASADKSQTEMVQNIVSVDDNIACRRNILGASARSDLRELLLDHKAQSDFPTIYAGKGEGRRIDGLLELGISEVMALFEQVKEAVSEYGLSADASKNIHRIKQPVKAAIESWAVIFTGDGHEDWHCHPAGWLSGVYYLDVPDSSDGQSGAALETAGQIEFGPLKLGKHNDLEAWPKKQITPENDMLLLFPSYFGHRTYPTAVAAPRISIAFDIVPIVGS